MKRLYYYFLSLFREQRIKRHTYTQQANSRRMVRDDHVIFMLNQSIY